MSASGTCPRCSRPTRFERVDGPRDAAGVLVPPPPGGFALRYLRCPRCGWQDAASLVRDLVASDGRRPREGQR